MRPLHFLLGRSIDTLTLWITLRWVAVMGLVLVSLSPSGAQAEPRKRVAVLALESDMMIDEVAKGLRQAICDALSERSPWEIHETQVSLAQLSLAHDCVPSDVACLQRIASQFELDSLLFGRVSRSDSYTTVRLSRFDTATKAVERTAESTFARTSDSATEVDKQGRELVSELFDTPRPQGVAVAPSGPEVAAEPLAVAQTARASEMPPAQQDRVVVESSSNISGQKVAGYAALGVAAVATGLSVFSFVQIQQAQQAPGFEAYRRAVGSMRPDVEDVCANVDSDNSYGLLASQVEEARISCNRGKTYQLLQFVFLGSALISGGLGAFLILGDTSERDSDHERDKPALTLQPSFGRGSAALQAKLRF